MEGVEDDVTEIVDELCFMVVFTKDPNVTLETIDHFQGEGKKTTDRQRLQTNCLDY